MTMTTEKAKPGDTILVTRNDWNSEWMIDKEFTVIKHASCGYSDEVTVKTPQGDHFVKHHSYKIVRSKGEVDAPNGEVWLKGLEATSQQRPSHGPTRNLTLLEKGGQTATKDGLKFGPQAICPDCKGTGKITMLKWDIDCNCVK